MPVNPVTVTHWADSSAVVSDTLPRPGGRGRWKLSTSSKDEIYDRGDFINTSTDQEFSPKGLFVLLSGISALQVGTQVLSSILKYVINLYSVFNAMLCSVLRLVVRRLRPVQPQRHVLHPRATHREAERYQVALLQGPQLLATSHGHDDPPTGLLVVFWTRELLT